MTISDQILASGEPFAFEHVENLDWFDQPLAAVAKVRDFGWVLHLLVAWNADERRGVRLYFPITNTMASSLTVEAVALEEIEATLSAIVSNYRGYLLVSVESEPYLSEAGKILESKECSTLSKPCLNLDRIMNNAEMMAWIALAEGA